MPCLFPPPRRAAGPLSRMAAAAACALATLTLPAQAADEIDPLDLQAAPAATSAPESPLRLAVEAGVGRIDQRFGAGSEDGRRVSVDLRYNARLGDSWRVSLSDRLDDVHPTLGGQRSTTNSLREAFVGWQENGGNSAVDLGRINLRQGPAYGYNPTDYFRTGGLRAITTADPVTLREMRLGTFMLRGSQLWPGGGVSLALAPKLDDGPDPRSGALDWGATNSRNRALATVNARWSERLSGQGSVLLERGASKLGVSVTALATDALVAYAELSTGKTPRLLDTVLANGANPQRAEQAALGLTYTLPSALAITLEAEYNGAGLDRAGWNTVLAQGPLGYQRYIAATQPSQELGSRRAWLVYASQKGLGLKQLDLTAFLRTNAIDHSRMVWTELRYHWDRFDAVLQWQRSSGRDGSEFGVMPYRQVIQVLGVFYL